jgi:hypothetical protein
VAHDDLAAKLFQDPRRVDNRHRLADDNNDNDNDDNDSSNNSSTTSTSTTKRKLGDIGQ